MSSFEDAEKFLKFLVTSFIAKTNLLGTGVQLSTQPFPAKDEGEKKHLVWDIQLKSIIIYPVKSCGGFSVHSWPLCKNGLLYDREWLLKGPNGEILTQKKIPKLCYIHAFINLGQGKLYLESSLCREKLPISLQPDSSSGLKEEMNVYGRRYKVQIYDDEVNMWFTEAIGRPCTFVRCLSSESLYCMNNGDKSLCRDMRSKLNFVNEAPLLLISEGSVSDLNKRINLNVQKIKSELEQSVDEMRFRPNLVISGAEPYAEDRWNSLYIGNAYFMSVGGCNRCQMINLEQKAGQVLKSNEPLATLASYRRVQGKILFGVLLRFVNREEFIEETWLTVGQQVYPSTNEKALKCQ